MRVFLTGATGFVGSYVLRALLERGYTVRCLLREGSLDELDAGTTSVVEMDSSKDSVVEEMEVRPGGTYRFRTAFGVVAC